MYMKKKMYMRQTQYSVVVIHVLKQSQFNCFAMSGGGRGYSREFWIGVCREGS